MGCSGLRRPSVLHQMPVYDLRPIDAARALDLRRALLPGSEALPDDEHTDRRHVGVFKGEVLVGIGATLPQPMPGGRHDGAWRVRGLAVEHGHRGRGLGTLLLQDLFDHATSLGGTLAWALVPPEAAGFFVRHRFDGPAIDDRVRLMSVAIRPSTRSWAI